MEEPGGAASARRNDYECQRAESVTQVATSVTAIAVPIVSPVLPPTARASVALRLHRSDPADPAGPGPADRDRPRAPRPSHRVRSLRGADPGPARRAPDRAQLLLGRPLSAPLRAVLGGWSAAGRGAARALPEGRGRAAEDGRAGRVGHAADPTRVRTRTLTEETRRVFRARVANPWARGGGEPGQHGRAAGRDGGALPPARSEDRRLRRRQRGGRGRARSRLRREPVRRPHSGATVPDSHRVPRTIARAFRTPGPGGRTPSGAAAWRTAAPSGTSHICELSCRP